MLCQNCGKHEANVKYTEVINGVKKEMNLCEKCAKKLGIEDEMNFDIPMDLPSFLGEFLDGYSKDNVLPSYIKEDILKCDRCGMTYEEFANSGRAGCENCYDAFKDKLDPILKNFHVSNRHVGRKAKVTKESEDKILVENKIQNEETKDEKKKIGEEEKVEKVEQLKEELKKAIKEERYEDAATLRDEIKDIEKKK